MLVAATGLELIGRGDVGDRARGVLMTEDGHESAWRGRPLRRLPLDPLTRRHFLGVLGGAGAAVALAPLVSCTTGSEEKVPSPAPTGGVQFDESTIPGPGPVSGGKYGGGVVAGYGRPYDNNDPARGEDLFSYDIITNFVFFGAVLAFQGQTGPPMANIAELPQVSQDKKTLTFTVRDFNFENGRAITADDIKWSLDRILLPETRSWGASLFGSIEGAQAVIDGKTKTADGIEVVDSKTFKLHLTNPDFTVLYALCQPPASPVPQEEVERLGADFSKTPIGYGPFKIESFDEGGQVAHLVRNDNFFYEGLPYIDTVEMHWGSDYQALLLQQKSEAIDVIADGISGTVLGQAKTDPSLSPLLKEVNILQTLSGQFNLTTPPFDNLKVRQALNWAVNRDDMAKVLHGAGVPDGAPYPLGIQGYESTFEPYGYDPDKARQLLDEAGFPDGFEVKFTSDNSEPFPAIAQIVQQNWADIGVKADLELVRFSVWNELSDQGKLPVWMTGWFMVYPTPADKVNGQYITGASENNMRYSNPQVDALSQQANETFDDAERNTIYAQIESIVGEDAPELFLVSTAFWTTVAEKLQNWHWRGEYGSYFDRIWIEE
jgi:peptide/nickel transport system substrate-binding protein